MKENCMRFKNIVRLCVGIGLLGFTPGCIKYHDLVRSEFPQGKKQPEKHAVAQMYRRSCVVYNDFSTQGIFDGLWLSDQLRKAYVDVYGGKRGLSQDAQEEILKRQLEENKHWMTFLLLADVPEKTNVSLSDPEAAWTVYAVVDGKKLIPAEKKEGIKEVELEPEYQLFFGDTFNTLKTPYLIRMPITIDIAEKIAQGNVRSIKLVISSVQKECVLEWTKEQITQKKKVLRDEDFYWG
jgi:hypothetical protein